MHNKLSEISERFLQVYVSPSFRNYVVSYLSCIIFSALAFDNTCHTNRRRTLGSGAASKLKSQAMLQQVYQGVVTFDRFPARKSMIK